jgi:hypothetical protein
MMVIKENITSTFIYIYIYIYIYTTTTFEFNQFECGCYKYICSSIYVDSFVNY